MKSISTTWGSFLPQARLRWGEKGWYPLDAHLSPWTNGKEPDSPWESVRNVCPSDSTGAQTSLKFTPGCSILHVPCVQAGIAGRWKFLVSHPTKSWGAVSGVKHLLDATLRKWKFPRHMVTPAPFRCFHSHNRSSIVYFLRKTTLYYWSTLIVRKFWSVFVSTVAPCLMSHVPLFKYFKTAIMFLCLLNFSFRLKIETSHLGIKKRRERVPQGMP